MQPNVASTERDYETGFKQGIVDCAPTLLGYISIGLAFGVVGVASQLSIMEIGLIALLIYAGSAQFILCALLLAQTPVTVIIFTIFIVNLRHLLMSFTLAPYFTRYSVWRNIGFGTLLTDETFGVATTQLTAARQLHGNWMDGLNLTAYSSWVASCIAGALVGQWVADPESWGLDFAMTAMFVALLVVQLLSNPSKLKHHLLLIGYMLIAMYLFMSLMPTHLAVLISTVVVATIGVWTEK